MLEILDCKRCQAVTKLPGGCTPIPGDGSDNPIFMFITEKSDLLSSSLGICMMDTDGEFLSKLLKEVGIDESKVYFTTLVKCMEFSKKYASSCYYWLDIEIARLKPKYIVTFGAKVEEFLASKHNIIPFKSLHQMLNGSSKYTTEFKTKLKELYDISQNG